MARPAPDRLLALLAELQRRRGGPRFDPAPLLFGPQRALVRSKARRKVVKCSRRAGKTYGVDVALLDAALCAAVAGLAVLYITLTRANAKEIAWPDLLELNERLGLGGVPNLTDLSMAFPGRGVIQLRGVNNEREIAKIRGKKFALVIIDEAQSIPDRILRPLIREVIGPALLDYSGSLWLVGTPPPVRAGMFYESYAGPLKDRWEFHGWTLRDNVMLPARVAGASIDDILAEVRAENGWTVDDPTYRREYLGEDVEDLDALLFEWRAERNAYDAKPDGDWTYIIGVDIGFDDSDAIAVLGWQRHSREVFLVEEAVASGRDVTDLAEAASAMVAKYNPVRAVIDQGGLGKKIAMELRRRHGIALEAADKHRKPEYIKLINADLRKGRLKARHESAFAEDCRLVRKDPEALAKGELRELPAAKGGYHSDICDAVLYAWRTALAFLEEPKPEPKDTAVALREARIAQAAKRAQRARGEDDDFPGFGQD